MINNDEEYTTYTTYNNGITNVDENSRSQISYEHSINQEENSVDGDSQQEIIQNTENNLIYTVLGSKKQTITTQDKLQSSDVEFVEVCIFL